MCSDLSPTAPGGKVLVTGASGFIGSVLCEALARSGFQVRGTLRKLPNAPVSEGRRETIIIGDISDKTDWRAALEGINVVVHLAAQSELKASEPGAADTLRKVNVGGTQSLVRQAIAEGVRRLVLVSSVKVNGEKTAGRAFTEGDEPAPRDAYAVSKLEAERVLHTLAAGTGLETVIVRPPLVYGPRVKGNFLGLMRWIDRGLPLPLANVNNRRSLIALDNLIDFLRICIMHPAAAGETFLVSDGEDLSTSELLRRIARALGRPARLWPAPPLLLDAGARLAGKGDLYQKLSASLQIDPSKASRLLKWQPPAPVDEALKRTADWYRNETQDLDGLK